MSLLEDAHENLKRARHHLDSALKAKGVEAMDVEMQRVYTYIQAAGLLHRQAAGEEERDKAKKAERSSAEVG